MYAWFFPDTKSDKLKYTQKEYLQLLEAVRPVLKKLAVKASDLEKVSYVLRHMEVLDEQQQKRLTEAFAAADQQEGLVAPPQRQETAQSEKTEKTENTRPQATRKGRKRVSEAEADEDGGQQLSERRTRQKK